MPLDVTPHLTPIEQGYVSELFLRLQPGATAAYAQYILIRTKASWQADMQAIVYGTSYTSLLPAYEQAYVSEFYLSLLAGATNEYNQYILLRTPAEWQTEMAALIGTGAPFPADAWKAAVVAGGGSVSDAQKTRITNLVNNLKASGAWAGLDRIWIFAAENPQQANIDLIAASACTPMLAPTFTAMRGYKGNGTTQWINSNFNPNTGTNKYVIGDASMGVWLETALYPGCSMGNEDGGYGNLQFSNTNRVTNIHATTTSTLYTPAAITGFWHGQRTSNAAGSTTSYGLGGTLEFTGGGATAGGTALPPRTFAFLACNHTTPTKFTASRLSAGWIGKSLTQAQITAFHNALDVYLRDVGVPTIDNDVRLWLNQMVATWGANWPVSGDRINALSKFVAAEKAAGNWQKTDDYWVLWGETVYQARLSLKQRRTASEVATPTFTANVGYAFNGTTQYLNTGFIPSTHAVAMTSTNMRLAAYEQTNVSTTGATTMGSSVSGTQRIVFNAKRGAANNVEFAVNGTTGDAFTVLTSQGFTAIGYNPTSLHTVYKNGAALSHNGVATFNNTGLTTFPLAIAVTNSAAPGGFRACTAGIACVGATLTPVQELAQYQNVETLRFDCSIGVTYDFTQNVMPSGTTFTRAGAAWALNKANVLTQYATDVPRFRWDQTTGASLGLLIEGARTNSIRNNTCVGAVPGTPGTLPTNWAHDTLPAGITRTIVGVGQEDGIDYIDFRYSGAAVVGAQTSVKAEGFTNVPAADAQTWTGATFVRLMAGNLASLTGGAMTLTVVGRNAGASGISSNGINVVPTSAPLVTQRYTLTLVMAGATIVGAEHDWRYNFLTGVATDFTVRIGLSQLEQGYHSSTPIKTSTVAVTRANDIALITDARAFTDAVLVVKARIPSPTSPVANNRLYIRYSSSNDFQQFYRPNGSTQLVGSVVAAGVSQAGNTVSSIADNTDLAVATRTATNDFAVSVNGSAVTTDASVIVPAITAFRIGTDETGNNPWFSTIKSIETRPTASDADLIALSSVP